MKALITGASRGLGLEIAKSLAKADYEVVLIASNSDRLSNARKEILAISDESVHVFPCDFSNPTNIQDLLVKLQKQFGFFDVMVNNVGAFEMGDLGKTTYGQVLKLLNINFKATFLLTQGYLPAFKKAKKGHIFNIGSIVTEEPRKEVAAYTISKFALNGYTKMLCDDLKDYGVKVTEIIPGSINTSSWDGIDAPKQDFVQTSDIAQTVIMCLNSSKGANFEQLIVRPTNRNF